MLDRCGKGWVTGPEITEALSDYGVFPHKEDVYLFTRHYDRDSDGRVVFSDFCDAFLPLDACVAANLQHREAYQLNKNVCRPMYFSK